MPGHFGRSFRPVCAACSALGYLLLGAMTLQAQQPTAPPANWPASGLVTSPQTAQPQSGASESPRAAFSQGFRPLAPVSEYYPTEEQKTQPVGTPIPETISAAPTTNSTPRTTAHAPAVPSQNGATIPAQTMSTQTGAVQTASVGNTAETNGETEKRTTAASLPLSRPGNGEEGKESDRGRVGSTSSQLGMTVVALTAVLLLIAVLAKVLKKHTPLASQSLPDDVLSLLGRKMIDQRNAVQFLRLGDRILVVGVSVDGLRTLAEITDPVEVDRIAGACHTPAGESTMSRSFRFLLSRQNDGQQDTETPRSEAKPARKKRFSLPSAPSGFSWETPDVSEDSGISQNDIAELTRTLQEARETNR